MGCIWSCEGGDDNDSFRNSSKRASHRAAGSAAATAARNPATTSATAHHVGQRAHDYDYTPSWIPTAPPAYRLQSLVRDVHTTCQLNTAKLNLIPDKSISLHTNAEFFGFGQFRCPCCHRYWESRKAWKTEKQGCSNCADDCKKHGTKNCSHCYVYPTGWRLLTAEERVSDPGIDHKQSLCTMCKKLGYHCGAKPKRDNRRGKESSGPRYIARKRPNLPHRPPSYNAAIRQKTFTAKRFGKY